MNSHRRRSIAEYSRAAWRRRLAIILPALILASATGLALRERPGVYESTARMCVAPTSTGAASDLSMRLNQFRQQLNSREILEELITINEFGAEPSPAGLSQMSRRISVEPDAGGDGQPGAFTVSFRASDPEKARAATDQLALRLVTPGSREPASAVSGAAILRKRAADLSLQLRRLEEKDPWLTSARSDLSFIKLSQSAGTSEPSIESTRAQQMAIEGLKDQQYKIQQQLTDAERRITAQRQIIEQQKKGSILRDNPTYAVLIAKRTELQGQRDTLLNRQELTDKHPRVLAINDQIAAINRQIEELRQDAVAVNQSPEARELAALESERNRLKLDLEITGRELVRRSATPATPAAAPDSSRVRRSAAASKLADEYFSLKRAYQETTNELQLADTKLQRTDGASAEVRVLEPATLPQQPASPNRLLMIGIAAGIGLGLGAAFTLFAESRRFATLLNAADVEYYTRLPLLAAIPRTAAATERRRARWRAVGRAALATATSGLAIFALSRIFIAADIFALIVRK